MSKENRRESKTELTFHAVVFTSAVILAIRSGVISPFSTVSLNLEFFASRRFDTRLRILVLYFVFVSLNSSNIPGIMC